ncbi:M28 family peptidase [Aestuariibacter halophilus]|uniref:M28 family peptidase n=1 Tax=Fluctibacter halophilus TaxID=226011 RepID=A0ABS8GBB4_9ALTE|nr:M28 family peptidase [Aestuariibacter halophilus]MCC2617501.1 M28 family peptidase [Aestuariibacter halophilus]
MACTPADQSSPKGADTSSATEVIEADPQRLRAHLFFLADDLMQGRDTGSEGHEIASRYIASQFEQYGLQPGGDSGTYMQRIPFRQSYLDQSSPQLTLISEQGQESLTYPSQFIMSADSVAEQASVSAELVFVGYGIVAPLLGHDDYQDMDVEGKIVVVLHGKPASFPSEEGAHFGSSAQKARHAAANGAVGMISLSTPTAEKVRPYQNLLNYLHMPSVRWLDSEGQPANVYPQLLQSAYLSAEAAAKLFVNAPASLQDIYAQLDQDQAPEGFALNLSASLSSASEHRTITSPNVVAILPGSDPQLRDEYVVYSAHSDHIGLSKSVKKDRINNGAMDNSTGVAVLLETARMFSQQATPPKRSIVFVAVTGEEKGLLGSDYFARNPTVPGDAMVANVNLDMPILTYPFADVIAFGANHSDLADSVADAAGKVGIALSPDPWPEMALFTRSDHYSFVKQGVPSVFLVPGLKSSDPAIEGQKQFTSFLHTHYHKPSDDLNQPFNWQAATTFTEVNFNIGLTLANQEQRPSWHEGDFFGDTFASPE